MMPNLLQYPVALFGILRAGLVVVNVNPLYTARELQHQLTDSGSQVILIYANFAATLQSAAEKNAGAPHHRHRTGRPVPCSRSVFCST